MSRTFKDRKFGRTYWREQRERETIEFAYEVREVGWDGKPIVYQRRRSLQRPGVRPKLRKDYVNKLESACYSTPMWWIREMMNRPERKSANQLTREAVKYRLEDIDAIDIPDLGRNPHIYYW